MVLSALVIDAELQHPIACENQTILTPSNVRAGDFGELFRKTLDGQVYAQPLYMWGLSIPGDGIHNVVFVVTEHDSVYAFDADSNTGPNATPLWHVQPNQSGGRSDCCPGPKTWPAKRSRPRSASPARR